MDHSEVKHLPKVDHTPAELDEVSKLLLLAADIFELESDKCTWSAICSASQRIHGNRYTKAGDDAGLRFARNLGFTHITQIFQWNDSRPRREVLAKIRAVALVG